VKGFGQSPHWGKLEKWGTLREEGQKEMFGAVLSGKLNLLIASRRGSLPEEMGRHHGTPWIRSLLLKKRWRRTQLGSLNTFKERTRRTRTGRLIVSGVESGVTMGGGPAAYKKGLVRKGGGGGFYQRRR